MTVEEVEVREFMPVMTIRGKVRPNDKAAVAYPNEVRVQEVFVNKGSYVNEGEPLFRIAEDEITNQLNISRARKTELETLIDKNTNIMQGREGLLDEGKVDQGEITRLEKEIAQNQAELERVKAEIEKLSYDVDHALVTSPISGLVTRKNVSAGGLARAGDAVIAIVNINPAHVAFSLNGKISEEIAVDAPLDIYIDEIPNKKFTGKISYISPELEGGGNFEILLAVPNEERLLKSEMTATLEFKSDIPKHTYIVPVSSVMSRASQPYVYKVGKGVAIKTPITIGTTTGNQVEVIRGLEAKDLVVVKGAEDLFDGADVNIWR